MSRENKRGDNGANLFFFGKKAKISVMRPYDCTTYPNASHEGRSTETRRDVYLFSN